MNVKFYILNQTYSFKEVTSFNIDQNSQGKWITKIDDKVVEKSEFAPTNITVNDV